MKKLTKNQMKIDLFDKNYSAENLKNLYPINAKDFFNRTKISAFNFIAMKDIINLHLQPLSIKKRLSILDWGCGNSLWSFGLFKDAFITGVDISQQSLFHSRLNSEKNGFKHKFKGLLVKSAIKKLKKNHFDHVISFGLFELLDDKELERTFSKIYNLLKPGGKLFITHYCYRAISATYIPWLIRGGYSIYKKKMGQDIQKKTHSDVISFFKKIGFLCIDSGGFNPYPLKLAPLVFSNKGWVTRNSFLRDWYATRFIVFQKPF